MTAHHTLAKGHNRTAHGRRSRTGSVASSAASIDFQEPSGSGWRFVVKQFLTLTRQSNCVSVTTVTHVRISSPSH